MNDLLSRILDEVTRAANEFHLSLNWRRQQKGTENRSCFMYGRER